MVRAAYAVVMLGVAAMLSAACSQHGSSSEPSTDASGHDIVQADGLADAGVADLDLAPDWAGDSVDTGIQPVPCPVGRGELDKSEADEMNGKPCNATVGCGGFDYCDCTAWCDCVQGFWVCNSVCDDSCFDDVKDAL